VDYYYVTRSSLVLSSRKLNINENSLNMTKYFLIFYKDKKYVNIIDKIATVYYNKYRSDKEFVFKKKNTMYSICPLNFARSCLKNDLARSC
jgi:hypothetical protein